MTAQYPCSERPGATRTDVELFLKQCSQPRLESMLRAIQLRLGTVDERPGDLDCAQMVAHQLNNVLTVERVNELLRQLDEAAGSPGSAGGT